MSMKSEEEPIKSEEKFVKELEKRMLQKPIIKSTSGQRYYRRQLKKLRRSFK